MAAPRKRKNHRRGPNAKRTAIQHEEDLLFVADRYLKGQTHREIALALAMARPYTVSHVTIGHDVATIRERWEETFTSDTLEGIKVRELARIDRLEAQTWRYLEKSETDIVTMTENLQEFDIQGAQSAKSGTQTTTTKRSSRRLANPNWMVTIQWCIETRLTICGLLSKQGGTVVNVGDNAGAVINGAIIPILQLVAKPGAGIENPTDAANLLAFPTYTAPTLPAVVVSASTEVIPRA